MKKVNLGFKSSNLFLVMVFLFYLLVAYKSSGYHQEDEHYQIIEFANYKMGLLPSSRLAWEFGAQLRPGFQPLLCFFFLKIFHCIGIVDGYNIAFLLRAVSALVSVFVILKFIGAFSSTKPHIAMAADYIKPMAEFLNVKYFVPMKDAIALAWAGVTDADAYKNSTQFEYDKDAQGNPLMVSKSDAEQIAASYADNSVALGTGSKKGTPVCP